MAKKIVSRSYSEIIGRLDNLKGHCIDMTRDKDASEVWQQDVEALTEAMDIIADYEAVTAEAAEMVVKYETPVPAIKRAPNFYQCPSCGKRTGKNHTHCHWCGKRLSYEMGA